MPKEKNSLLGKINDEYLENLCKALGGVENIVSSTHCLTRFRIVPKDKEKIDGKAIEAMEGVKGTFFASNQYQIVFGTEVAAIYDKFAKKFNLNKMEKSEVKKNANKDVNFLKRLLNWMSDIFIPIVPVLVSGGIILGLRNIFEANFNENYFLGFDADGNVLTGWSMVNVSQFMNGLDSFLWIPAQVCFWWLPVHICWSIFKRMGADEILGIVVGLTLLVDPLLNVYTVFQSDAAANSGIWIWDIVKNLETAGQDVSFDWGFMQYPWKISYTAQVIPAIGVGITGAYLNIWIKKVTPGVVSQIVVPTFTVIVSFTLAMFAIGPAGYIIGSAIGVCFQWALTDAIAKYFFAVIIGGLHAALVITGMHHLLNAVMLQNVASNGGDFIFMSVCAQAIGQGSAVLGWMIIYRKDPKAKEIGSSSVVAAYLGVTEPAIYGVNLKYLYPFVAGCIGSAVSLELCVIAGVTAQSIGNGSWLGILSVQVQSKATGVTTWVGTGYLWFMIANLLNAATSIILTMVFSKVSAFAKYDPNYIPTTEEKAKIEAKLKIKADKKAAKQKVAA